VSAKGRPGVGAGAGEVTAGAGTGRSHGRGGRRGSCCRGGRRGRCCWGGRRGGCCRGGRRGRCCWGGRRGGCCWGGCRGRCCRGGRRGRCCWGGSRSSPCWRRASCCRGGRRRGCCRDGRRCGCCRGGRGSRSHSCGYRRCCSSCCSGQCLGRGSRRGHGRRRLCRVSLYKRGWGRGLRTREGASGCPQQARGGRHRRGCARALRQRAAAETAQQVSLLPPGGGVGAESFGAAGGGAGCVDCWRGGAFRRLQGQMGVAGRQRQQARQPWVRAMQPRRLAATRVKAGLWGGVLWDQELAGVAWDPKQRGQEDLSRERESTTQWTTNTSGGSHQTLVTAP